MLKNTPSVYGEVEAVLSQNKAVELPVLIDTKNYTINAAEVYLLFDPDEIQVKNVSKKGSFFKLWIKGEPKFSNKTGSISFAGGLPTPGFRGKGQVGSVTIIPQRPGASLISFSQKTRILLNNGRGSEISLIRSPIKFKVQ